MAKSIEKSSESSASPGAIAVYSGEPFAILKQDVQQFPAILAANIGGGGINEFDMDRVGVPSGGGLSWSVPNLNGEPEAVNELVGVILLHGDRRAYWSQSFDDAGSSPPDCSSIDGRTGCGFIPGDARTPTSPKITRSCKTCPMSQWGSADLDLKPGKKPTNGQACSQRKIVFMLRQDDILPLVVDLAPTSLKAFQQFMLRLTSRGIPCHGAVVGLKLRQEKSNAGITYSVVAPRLLSVLSSEQTESMAAIAQAMRPYFEKTGVAVDSAQTVVEPTVRGESAA